MNYFQPYSFPADDTIVAAWDSQVAEAAETPRLAQVLAQADSDLFPRFAARYQELRALPRSARRALQRHVAHSRELAALVPEFFQQRGRRLQHRMAWSLAGAALLLALGQGIGTAATITVTTNIPGINPDGKCSLIEAIVNANDDAATHPDCAAGSGADTIVLPRRRTHTLTSVYGNYIGLLDITSPITIQGNGAKIVRKKSAPPFVLIAVNGSGELTLRNVALSGASFRGVFNDGILAIQNSAISGNSGDGVVNERTLAIQNSTISGNSGRGVINRDGSLAIQVGILTIQNSVISGNSGGGVSNYSFYNHSSATIENSTISGNSAYRGGGVFNAGFNFCGYYSCYDGHSSLTITNSTISGNQASNGGGAFNYSGDSYLSLVDSVITENSATSRGGGLTNYGSLNRTNTTISNNQAPVGPDVFP